MSNLLPIKVVCGLLEREGKLLLVQRGLQQQHPLQWEFPGGKVEEGETPEEALQREWQEELGVEISVGKALPTVQVQKSTLNIELLPYYCQLVRGTIRLTEHISQVWLTPEAALELELSAGDRLILEDLLG